ncbi:MAG: SGNH/GDSL hydrolase family protein, partial [Bullifex sp.]|nr:SGNH/GDSL hydrolase family protein [Bullifex sp.]
VFYTSPRFESEAYGLMVNALNKIAPDAGITIIDMWNDEAFNAARKDAYMADPIHPTEAGYRLWWTPYIEKKLSEIV